VTTLRAEPRIVAIESVAVTADDLITDFADGRRISLPLAWYPRLLHATPEERSNWRLVGNGQGVHWPDLDEDVSAENLILGQPSRESQSSLARWLRSRQSGG
jgi:hypothetical protein